MKYIGFNMIQSTSIPIIWPPKKTTNRNSPGIQQGFLSPLPFADFPSKLGMQNKNGNLEYPIQPVQPGSPHRHCSYNHCVQIKHAYGREYLCIMLRYAVDLLILQAGKRGG